MNSSCLRFGVGVVCIVALALESHAATVASSKNDCIYTSPSGKQIDLSPLNLELGYKVNSENYNSFFFYVNVCGAIGYSDFKDPDRCPNGTTGSCEVQVVGAANVAAESYGQSTSYSIVHQDGNGNVPPGAMLTYTTAENCPRNSKPLTTNIYFECNTDAHEPIIKMIEDNYWQCYLHVKIETTLVCEMYECDSTEQCVDVTPGSGSGVSKEDCEKTCSAPKYRCVGDRCVMSTDGGVSKDECDSGCANASYECSHNQCVQSDTGRFSRDECEKFCGPPSNFGVITEK